MKNSLNVKGWKMIYHGNTNQKKAKLEWIEYYQSVFQNEKYYQE